MSISINLDYTFNVVIHNRNLSGSHELVKRHRKTIKTVQHFAQLIHRYVKTSLVYIQGFIRIQSYLWLRARKIYLGAISRVDLAKNLVTYQIADNFLLNFAFFYLRNKYCKVILTLLTLDFSVTFALQGQSIISFILFNLLGALAVSSRCVVCNVCIKQNVYTTVSRFVSSLSLLINERATLSHIFYHVYNITLFLIPYIIQTRRICNMYG